LAVFFSSRLPDCCCCCCVTELAFHFSPRHDIDIVARCLCPKRVTLLCKFPHVRRCELRLKLGSPGAATQSPPKSMKPN
jgi:hypothetical protein